MFIINTSIAKSAVEGAGVFTAEEIAEGRIISKFEPGYRALNLKRAMVRLFTGRVGLREKPDSAFSPDAIEFDWLISTEDYLGAPPRLTALLDRYAFPQPDNPEFIACEVDNSRFMNHCKTPNTDYSNFAEGCAPRATAQGEELTCNYNDVFRDYELVPSGLEPEKAKRAIGV